MGVKLESKSARAKLAPRREPYWAKINTGLFLGYRVADDGGTWIGRRLRDDAAGLKGSARYVTRSFGAMADFAAAQKAVLGWDGGVAAGVTHKVVTVEDAARSYVASKRDGANGKAAAADAEGRCRRLIFGTALGRCPLDKLQAPTIRAWLRSQVDEDGDSEDERRSRDSANRNLACLKAILNFALADRLVASDAAWRPVTKFKDVGRRRERFLDRRERARLLDACEPELRAFAEGLLLTAARPGELAAATVGDVDLRAGTITLSGKTGRRTVALSSAAAAYMKRQAKAKLPAAPLFPDPSGRPWDRHLWKKGLSAAAAAAGLPGVVIYNLRHAAISELVMAGVDSVIVAGVAGTSVEMISEYYAHLKIDQTRARLDAVSML